MAEANRTSSTGQTTADKMRVALFVEVNDRTFLVALPPERMEFLLPLAASLADNGKLPLMPTGLFSFAAVREMSCADVQEGSRG